MTQDRCSKPGCGARRLLGKPCTDGDCPQQWVHHTELTGASLRDRALAGGEAADASSSLRDRDPSRDRWHLQGYDDGSDVFLSSYSGGGSAEGVWGALTLMQRHASGRVEFRRYRAVEDWMPSIIEREPRVSDEHPSGEDATRLRAEPASAVAESQTPEQRANYALAGFSLGNDPDKAAALAQSVLDAIRDAQTAATRAAYERGLKDGYDAGFASSAEGWNGEYPHSPPASETDMYRRGRDGDIRLLIEERNALSLIDKEPT